jgi:hypothetical protein
MTPIADCFDYQVQCRDTDYDRFERVCVRELAEPVEVDAVINTSTYCARLHIEDILSDKAQGLPGLGAYLPNATDETIGIYHLWAEADHCTTHATYLMECLYVGKGFSRNRIKDHMKNKSFDRSRPIFVTYYACENRIAKYLEQLFLDTYHFPFNTMENSGNGTLYARWNEDRFLLGTIQLDIANAYTDKQTRALEKLFADNTDV